MLNDMQGDSRVCIAILDSDVDMTHPSLERTSLERIVIPGLIPSENKSHGTYVASIIFSCNYEEIKGIAPQCRGIYIPIYSDGDTGMICDQDKLAEGIILAADAGAHIINISGGVITPDNSSSLKLAEAISYCKGKNIQVVAAVGNEGCDCLHVPASMPDVLAVGALDEAGESYPFNNYGHIYRKQGILASLKGIKGAVPGFGVMHKAASSYATPVVSGTMALLCTMQLHARQQINPVHIKELMLQTADQCPKTTAEECKRFLAGILNEKATRDKLELELAQGHIAPSPAIASPENTTPLSGGNEMKSEVVIKPSGINAISEPVYALGELEIGFGSDSLRRELEAEFGSSENKEAFGHAILAPSTNPHLPQFKHDRLYYADDIMWILNINGFPGYVISP